MVQILRMNLKKTTNNPTIISTKNGKNPATPINPTPLLTNSQTNNTSYDNEKGCRVARVIA